MVGKEGMEMAALKLTSEGPVERSPAEGATGIAAGPGGLRTEESADDMS